VPGTAGDREEVMTVNIDRDAQTVTHADGEDVDPLDIFIVMVTTVEGYGDPEVLVLPGLEGDGGEPVLRTAVRRDPLGGVDTMAIEEELGRAGYVPVQTEMAGSMTRQPGIWTETDFGFVGTALRA
jgi:hypothetical protein